LMKSRRRMRPSSGEAYAHTRVTSLLRLLPVCFRWTAS
jgi:hypothetical protein